MPARATTGWTAFLRESDQFLESIQELLRRGVLGPSLVISAAHTDADIEHTIDAAAGALGVYACAVEAGSTEGLLDGRPVEAAIRELAEPRQRPVDTAERRG
jgi:glutamate-1-semialdehyde 2,1-aminomutase